MGVIRDWENGTCKCSCGSCGKTIGPFKSDEELQKSMKNWSYAFVDDIGDTRCPVCVQLAFEDQQALVVDRDGPLLR